MQEKGFKDTFDRNNGVKYVLLPILVCSLTLPIWLKSVTMETNCCYIGCHGYQPVTDRAGERFLVGMCSHR